ncbi:hypothetical protein [Psychrobacter sp. FDAARGOS_221]|uniref:hypothetical protein n=1 Tax=Psychrobacter sp. FDAARGOS_221 TaxID=1975705 RepID=UPI000BB5771E|nr:hypothetical protein [Psychrobacter sp. FDAARGOS_221]PNK60195.1 hypothetical protein A6J60_004460 [Psychrobacter sp. FDAARGOS_221]
MLKILQYKDQHSLLSIILITCVRLVLTVGLCLFAFYFAVASTMGPAIAPEVWIGEISLDMIIRIGMLITSIGITLFAIVWLVYPLLRLLYNKITARYRSQ